MGCDAVVSRLALRRAAAVALAAAAVSLAPAAALAQAPAPSGPQTPPARTTKPPAAKRAPPRTAKAWRGRGFVVISAGARVAAEGYTSTAVFAVHAEDATLAANASIGIGPAFGARAGMRVWKNLALGGGVALVKASQNLSVTGRIPHPFHFNRHRDVEGAADGLDRVESLVALEASWLVALSRRLDMLVFGGPAYLHVRQDMAGGIRFTESYPYDTATYTGTETASASGGGFGVTGGLDVSYLLSTHLGVGAGLRYSRASATPSPSAEPSSAPLGGLQVAVGARILF